MALRMWKVERSSFASTRPIRQSSAVDTLGVYLAAHWFPGSAGTNVWSDLVCPTQGPKSLAPFTVSVRLLRVYIRILLMHLGPTVVLTLYLVGFLLLEGALASGVCPSGTYRKCAACT